MADFAFRETLVGEQSPGADDLILEAHAAVPFRAPPRRVSGSLGHWVTGSLAPYAGTIPVFPPDRRLAPSVEDGEALPSCPQRTVRRRRWEMPAVPAVETPVHQPGTPAPVSALATGSGRG